MPYKLLLADDSLTIHKVIELVLASEGFAIKAVTDGEQALGLLDSYAPDVVLADIQMPKVNGYQLCEKIKGNPAIAHIPVILLAGAFEPFDEDYARSIKADDFIIKPFESQELIGKVNALVSISASRSGESTVEVDKERQIEEAEMALETLQVESPVTVEDVAALEKEPVPIQPAEEPRWDEDIAVIKEEAVEEQAIDEEFEAAVIETSELKTEFGRVEEGLEFEEEFEEEFEKAAVEELAEFEMLSHEETGVFVGEEKGIPSVVQHSLLEIEAPSKEEILEMVKKTIEEKMFNIISADISLHLSSAIRDSVRQTVSGIAPAIIGNITREMARELLNSLRGEVETAIKKIVPEVAEAIIKKEIEKITSEIG